MGIQLNICKYCGKKFYSKWRNLYCSPECKARANYTKNESTICWDCKKATGFCSWSEDFTPVEGWKATPTRVKISNRQNGEDIFTDSFIVHECPLFERG